MTCHACCFLFWSCIPSVVYQNLQEEVGKGEREGGPEGEEGAGAYACDCGCRVCEAPACTLSPICQLSTQTKLRWLTVSSGRQQASQSGPCLLLSMPYICVPLIESLDSRQKPPTALLVVCVRDATCAQGGTTRRLITLLWAGLASVTQNQHSSHACASEVRERMISLHLLVCSAGAVTCSCRGQCTGEGAEGYHPSCQPANRLPPLQCQGGRPCRRQAPGQVPLLHGEGLGWLHRPQHQHQAWGLGVCCLQPAQLCQEPGLLQVWGPQSVSSSLPLHTCCEAHA